jgi:hypothetical protein
MKEEKIALILSSRKEGVMRSANDNQNCSRIFADDSELFPEIIAAFMAPRRASHYVKFQLMSFQSFINTTFIGTQGTASLHYQNCLVWC